MKAHLGKLMLQVARLFGYKLDLSMDDEGTVNMIVSVPSMNNLGKWWTVACIKAVQRAIEKQDAA